MAEPKRKRPRSSTPEAIRRHAYYIAHRPEIIAKAAEYAKKNKVAVKARIAAWRARNKDWNAARDRAYHQAHKEERAAWYASYSKSNPERLQVRDANRRARERSAIGKHTLDDIKAIGQAQLWACAMCRVDIARNYHIDHFVPLKLGGSNDRSNLQLLCKRCNLRKGAKHPDDFRAPEGHHG